MLEIKSINQKFQISEWMELGAVMMTDHRTHHARKIRLTDEQRRLKRNQSQETFPDWVSKYRINLDLEKNYCSINVCEFPLE